MGMLMTAPIPYLFGYRLLVDHVLIPLTSLGVVVGDAALLQEGDDHLPPPYLKRELPGRAFMDSDVCYEWGASRHRPIRGETRAAHNRNICTFAKKTKRACFSFYFLPFWVQRGLLVGVLLQLVT